MIRIKSGIMNTPFARGDVGARWMAMTRRAVTGPYQIVQKSTFCAAKL